MFVLEQEEYTREGINWTFIDFGLDLEACIELIEKPMGIIAMLDEECIVPKATDMTLAQKLNEQHLGKHPNFEKPKPPKGKQSEAHFAMRHYAGLVRYNVTNWLEKNKDPLNDTVAACLKASKGNALLNEIWADYTTQEEASNAAKSGGQKKKGKSGSFMTVSMLYRESLNNLMSMLYKTHPHFIRCIIPNEKKKSGLLDAALVLNQLTCNGVLEGIRICRKGFPNRSPHPDFVQRYAILGAEESKCSEDTKECALKMLGKLVDEGSLKDEMFKVGLTKVFFKAGVLAHLEDLRDARLTYLIIGFQAQIRYYFAMQENNALREELKELNEQLDEGTKTIDETRKLIRRFETHKEDLQRALDEAEAAIEVEEGKYERSQNEISKIRDETQRSLVEKDEQFENAKAAQQRAVETIQMANLKKQCENEIRELHQRNDQLSVEGNEISLAKRKLEADFLIVSAQLEEAFNESKILEERSKQIEANAAHLSEALREEQQKSEQAEKTKKELESNLRELQAKIDRTEMAMLRGGQKTVTKLEQRLNALTAELELEKRRYQDAIKKSAKHERKVRQLEFEVGENKKRIEEMQQMVEKLQNKAKEQKRMIDEAEEAATVNLQKYKQLYSALQRAEDRAENAENSLQKMGSNKPNLLPDSTFGDS
ncbi:Myosin-4 [Toxocara canis]|uniref:Myosin-4 n=1 Tax=Toxocara canis TaxID=6265 RepID=A0A0B2V1S3_TOXCA|nr:Myosin-4 [Toxocara canis]